MKMIIVLVSFFLIQSHAYSSLRIKEYIKDPIDDNHKCITHNVKWQGDKLVTISKSSGYIVCEYTGYKAYIFDEDKLSEEERNSIKAFLKFAKKHLKIKDKFNFFEIGLINELWLLKNIYERRNLTPKQHIKILDVFKKATIALLEDTITDQQELNNYCVGKDKEDKWCRSLVLKNKIWESYHKQQVKKENKESKIRRHKEKQKQLEIERNKPEYLCDHYEIAELLAEKVIENKLSNAFTYQRLKEQDFEGESHNRERLYAFAFLRTNISKPSEHRLWNVWINKNNCNTRITW